MNMKTTTETRTFADLKPVVTYHEIKTNPLYGKPFDIEPPKKWVPADDPKALVSYALFSTHVVTGSLGVQVLMCVWRYEVSLP
jgi:hypothetical protein